MITIVASGLALIVGVIVGALWHAKLAAKATATQQEIAVWAQDLRNVLFTETESAKDKIKALILKLEKKL